MAKRFVTYNTEDANAGIIDVDENGVMKPSSNSGSGEGLYCTDSNGVKYELVVSVEGVLGTKPVTE